MFIQEVQEVTSVGVIGVDFDPFSFCHLNQGSLVVAKDFNTV